MWKLLGEYRIVDHHRAADRRSAQAGKFDKKPLLVLTEDADIQEEIFFKQLKPRREAAGVRVGAYGTRRQRKTREERAHLLATLPPEQLLPDPPTNFRRWWNNSWFEVEEGGQTKAGDWTAADNARLRALVDRAHKLGYWIRFYTLDGFEESENRGWDHGYNFGSRAAAELRWRAALDAGVDLIATDQYEDLAAFHEIRRALKRSSGSSTRRPPPRTGPTSSTARTGTWSDSPGRSLRRLKTESASTGRRWRTEK